MVAHSKVKFGQFLIKRTQVYFIRITWVFLDQLFFQKFCKWLPQRVYTLSDLLIDLFRIFTFFFNISFQISSQNYSSINYMGRANKWSKSVSKRQISYANELKVSKGYRRNSKGYRRNGNGSYSVFLFSTYKIIKIPWDVRWCSTVYVFWKFPKFTGKHLRWSSLQLY